MRILLAAILLALTGAKGYAADAWPYEAECRKFANVAIPQRDIGNAPANCDSNILYYGADGSGRGANFAAARACAYHERTTKDDDVFSGADILMMIYANARGVPRNIPLAKRFACESHDYVSWNYLRRLEHLDKIAQHHDDGKLFDICDDVTTYGFIGFIEGVCAAHDAEFAAVKRQRRLDSVMASWTSSQKRAYAGLRKAADAYFAASAEGETDLSTPARGVLESHASEGLEEVFVTAIEAFEHGKQPTPAAAAMRAEDTRLNATYKAWMNRLAAEDVSAVAEHDPYFGHRKMAGSVTTNGVREAQRKWLAYREAWVAFGAARYPAVAEDAWRAWLTHERTALLKSESDDGN